MELWKAGKSVPAIENRPRLMMGLEFYVTAYNDLKSDRPVTMAGFGQIPWSSIIKWCHVNNIHDINDIGTTVRYIRAMEAAERQFDKDKEDKNDS